MELQRAGIKPSDEVEANYMMGSETNGSLYFEVKNGNRKFECVVWPDNYELVNSINEGKDELSVQKPEE